MAFTSSQLTQVESAIITVGAGGVAEIEDAFGNRTRYTSLAELLKLKEIIEADINKSAATTGMDKFEFVAKE